MSPFVLRVLRTLNAAALGNESVKRATVPSLTRTLGGPPVVSRAHDRHANSQFASELVERI
jgi:hypothetical protein